MNNKLYIIEIFSSVQGETSLTGLPTTFIRLARCNLRCSWCDTTYSFVKGDPFSIEQILIKVKEFGCKNVCITGGEPLLQSQVYLLMQNICDNGYTVSLETSGSLSTKYVDPRVKVILDIKCPGSGMSNKNLWSNLDILKENDEVKFVIKDKIDFDYATNICIQYQLFSRPIEVLYSPVFASLPAKDLVSWILQEKLPCRLNLQCHKFIWAPETKGV